jgi:PhnB protein
MVKAIPYILVKNGKKAIKLYEDIFGAKIVSHQPFSKEVGPQMGLPDDFDYENSTMHAELKIGRANIYLSDNPHEDPSKKSSNVEVLLDLNSKKQLESIYGKIEKNKKFKILMPLEKMFWGSYHTRFTDSEGIGWQLSWTPKK